MDPSWHLHRQPHWQVQQLKISLSHNGCLARLTAAHYSILKLSFLANFEASSGAQAPRPRRQRRVPHVVERSKGAASGRPAPISRASEMSVIAPLAESASQIASHTAFKVSSRVRGSKVLLPLGVSRAKPNLIQLEQLNWDRLLLAAACRSAVHTGTPASRPLGPVHVLFMARWRPPQPLPSLSRAGIRGRPPGPQS